MALGLTIDEIHQSVAASTAKRGVDRAGIFGTTARGEATNYCDVDFEEGCTLVDVAGLRLDLVETVCREVDVATPKSFHPELRDKILSELASIL